MYLIQVVCNTVSIMTAMKSVGNLAPGLYQCCRLNPQADISLYYEILLETFIGDILSFYWMENGDVNCKI